MLFVEQTLCVKKSCMSYFLQLFLSREECCMFYAELQQSTFIINNTTYCTVFLQHLFLLPYFSLIFTTVKFNRMGPHSNHRFLIEERRLQSSDY